MSTDQDYPTDATDSRAASPAAAQPAAGVPDIPPAQKKIEELREKAKDEQSKRKDAELKLQQIDAEIGALGQVTEDLKKISADYLKEYDGLKAARQHDSYFEADEKKCLANILGDVAVGKVTEKVAELLKPITELQKVIDDDAAKLDTYKTMRDKKEGIRDAKKKDFEKQKATAATIKNYQKDPLDALEREIRAAQDAGNFAIAYWLLVSRFAKKLQDTPEIPAPANFDAKLIAARDAYVTAIADFYDSDTTVKAAEKALETKRADIAEKKKNFEVDVREALSAIKPQRQAA
ncbi:hypothetical protein JQ636_12450 [Bradyrhizobium japonicum]|uniref:hypothetical protein n=1 Tax=Bradyrhizobium japonicum TaxID=375 RepID=UPI001BAC2D9C|nr:hypothetical protein [Bradyrhizobium japonicum]MBR0804351.1 hypothetical protein [Bradyrhizobium japonicum]